MIIRIDSGSCYTSRSLDFNFYKVKMATKILRKERYRG